MFPRSPLFALRLVTGVVPVTVYSGLSFEFASRSRPEAVFSDSALLITAGTDEARHVSKAQPLPLNAKSVVLEMLWGIRLSEVHSS